MVGAPAAVANAASVPPLARTIALYWILAAAVLVLVHWGERRPLSSIGIESPDAGDALWAAVATAVGVGVLAATEPLVRAAGLASIATEPAAVATGSLLGIVAFSITAGVVEEIAFRGYALERLAEQTGRLDLAAAATALGYAALHVGAWGLGGALQWGAWTVVLTALYVRRRNLPACIAMHACSDVLAFVVLV